MPKIILFSLPHHLKMNNLLPPLCNSNKQHAKTMINSKYCILFDYSTDLNLFINITKYSLTNKITKYNTVMSNVLVSNARFLQNKWNVLLFYFL